MTYTIIFSKGDHKVEREVNNAVDVADIILTELKGYEWEFKDERIEKQWQSITKGEMR